MMQCYYNTLQRGRIFEHGVYIDCIKQKYSQQIEKVVQKDYVYLQMPLLMATERSINVKTLDKY